MRKSSAGASTGRRSSVDSTTSPRVTRRRISAQDQLYQHIISHQPAVILSPLNISPATSMEISPSSDAPTKKDEPPENILKTPEEESAQDFKAPKIEPRSPVITRRKARCTTITVGETSGTGTSSETTTSTATKPKNMPVVLEPRNLRRRGTRLSSAIDAKSPTPPVGHPTPACKYQIDQKLEAKDEYGKWYSSRIMDIDESGSMVRVHFDSWSNRYDEWIDVNSDRLREMAAETSQAVTKSLFQIGEIVLGKWAMGKYYPAKILSILDENRYKIIYDDGWESVVRRRALRRMPEEQLRTIDMEKFGLRINIDSSASNLPSAADVSVEETSVVSQAAEAPPKRKSAAKTGTAVRLDAKSPVKSPMASKTTLAVKTVGSAPKTTKFMTTTQKWRKRQMEAIRSPPRKAAGGGSAVIAQLSPNRTRNLDEILAAVTAKVMISTSSSTSPGTSSTPQSIHAEPIEDPEKASPAPPPAKKRRVVTRAESIKTSVNTATETVGKEYSTSSISNTVNVAEVARDPGFLTPKEEFTTPPIQPIIIRPSAGQSLEDTDEEMDEPLVVYSRIDNRRENVHYYHKHDFKPEWLVQFPWLVFENGAMFCKYCRECYPTAQHGFVKGIANGFLIHRLIGHEKAIVHMKAEEKCGVASVPKQPAPVSSIEDKTIPDKESDQATVQELTRVKTPTAEDIGETMSQPDKANENTEQAQRLFLFWQNGREAWLRLENNRFFCKACRLHNQAIPGPTSLWNWSVGIPISQANNIPRHVTSSTHLAALQYLQELEQGAVSAASIVTERSQEDSTVSAPVQDEAFPQPSAPLTSTTTSQARPHTRQREQSSTSDSSATGSDHGSTSTVTATATPMSMNSSMDRKLVDYQYYQEDNQEHTSGQDSPASSTLSHLAEDDVVRCVCEAGGEDGWMLQCEQCMTWQHGVCVGIEGPESTPSEYFCYICQNPPGLRPSVRYEYEVQKTWLETGILPRYPWPTAGESSSANFARAKVTLSTNTAARTVKLLIDRLKATRHMIQKMNNLPPGPGMAERKEAMKKDIMATQEAVEKELDTLEPFVAELEAKFFAGRMENADAEFAQTKLDICKLIQELDKMHKMNYFLQ